MTTLKFNPTVFTVSYAGVHGDTTWEFLTVDGENPDETVFFNLKGDMPSSVDWDIIRENFENGDFEKNNLEDTDFTLADFEIDLSIFQTSGGGYEEIRKELIEQIPLLQFSKDDIIGALMRYSESYYGESQRLYNYTKEELIEKLEDCSEDFTALELLMGMEEGF